MELAELQRHWEVYGRVDPYWAVLTQESRRYGGWENQLEEFFASGRAVVGALMEELGGGTIEHISKRRALDFGCGVGRLTQALGDYFDECVGVDIAPSMIQLAESHNRHGSRCTYRLNQRDDLSAFPDGHFDLVFSLITLQHIRPDYARRYIAEFVRVLAPGGVAVFQVPGEFVPPGPTNGADQPAEVIKAMPASAFHAGIEVVEAPRSMKCGERHAIRVRVENLGDAVWPAGSGDGSIGQVRLGNHWLIRDGSTRPSPRMLLCDDARTPLPRDLAPGESTELTLNVLAPPEPGRYILELDMVQEGHAWFTDRGSVTSRVEVRSWRPWSLRRWRADAPNIAFTPVMETHGIPRDEVVAVVEEAGGRAIEIREGRWNGEGWKGYQYFVAK